MLNDRLKNQNMELTLLIDCLKNEVGVTNIVDFAESIFDDRCLVIAVLHIAIAYGTDVSSI
jgi:hypothetical protein